MARPCNCVMRPCGLHGAAMRLRTAAMQTAQRGQARAWHGCATCMARPRSRKARPCNMRMPAMQRAWHGSATCVRRPCNPQGTALQRAWRGITTGAATLQKSHPEGADSALTACAFRTHGIKEAHPPGRNALPRRSPGRDAFPRRPQLGGGEKRWSAGGAGRWACFASTGELARGGRLGKPSLPVGVPHPAFRVLPSLPSCTW